MLIHFKHLCLEVTESCNMKCAHCMRGEPREIHMQADTVDRIFREVRHIDHLTITGGEPSLVPWAVQNIVYSASRWDVTIGAFFCSTNAGKYSQQFSTSLSRLYDICQNKKDCILTVTLDRYHSKALGKALKEYMDLPFYKPVNARDNMYAGRIVTQGRAAKNGLGTMDLPLTEYIYDYSFDGIYLTVGDVVYINAEGNVLLSADLSYESQEENILGNVCDGLDRLLMQNLYIPKNEKDKYMFSINIIGGENTIFPQKNADILYYADEAKATSDFNTLIHNLFINPTSDERRRPKEVKLVSRAENIRNDINLLDSAVLEYKYGVDTASGIVKVELYRHQLEDRKDAEQ